MFRTLLIITTFLACASHGARILGIVPTPSFSHQIAFFRLWEELSLQGHEVVLITTNPLNNPNLTNLREINLHSAYDIFKENNMEEVFLELKDDFVRFIETLRKVCLEVTEEFLSHPEVQDLIHGNHKFDVVLAEFLFPEMYYFGRIFDCPVIALSSMDATTVMHDLMGNMNNPISHPEMVLPMYGRLNFKERLTSWFYNEFIWYYKLYYSNAGKEVLMRKYFNTNTRIDEMEPDMMFINYDPVLQKPRAVGQTTIFIGGGNHIMRSKPLPQDVQTYLDSATNGSIYFSLGSNVKSKNIRPEKLKAFLDTFRQLPYKILWKFEADTLSDLPDNVKLVKWLPQQDVLRHPNTKLFITQGGIQSVDEAIFSHVPMLVLPFFADQKQNALRVQLKGMGLLLNHDPLDKSEFLSGINEIINNPKYKENVVRLAKLSQDQPSTGVERGVWWTNYVIRNKGAKDLKDQTKNVPVYQYYLLDIYGALIGGLMFLLFITWLIFRAIIGVGLFIYRKISCSSLKEKTL